MKVAVMGYGNQYRQDDGAGHVLGERIHRWLEEQGVEAELILDSQLVPEAALDVAGCGIIVFADARVGGEDEFSVSAVQSRREMDGLNIHTVGAGWFLDLVKAVNGVEPSGVMVSVRGESFDFAEGLTPECTERTNRAFEAFSAWWLREMREVTM